MPIDVPRTLQTFEGRSLKSDGEQDVTLTMRTTLFVDDRHFGFGVPLVSDSWFLRCCLSVWFGCVYRWWTSLHRGRFRRMKTFYIIPKGFVKPFLKDFVKFLSISHAFSLRMVEFVSLDIKRIMYVTMKDTTNQVTTDC